MAKGLLKSTAVVSGMTMISRILGFARDVVIARTFGASMGTDAFFVAFKIPNFLRRLFAEGAFSQAFVPVLSEYKSCRSKEEVRELIARTSGTLGVILFVITLIGVLAAPLLMMAFAPGFIDEPEKMALASDMLMITFPYLFFISLTALAGGILNSYGKFAVPAFTPVFLNIVLIASAIFLAPKMDEPITALAWGVFIAGAVQLAFQFPFLIRMGLLPMPKWGRKDEGVGRIMKLMLPAIFGVSVSQINLLLDTLIASFLITGSVSWLYYSDRLMEFPLGVLGIALATVILPSLSQKHAEASTEDFSRTLDWGLRWVLLIGTPAAVGLMVLAGPMLSTLFQYGAFTEHDVAMAQMSLIAYGMGLLGFILIKVLAPGYFARQDTKTPVKIGIIAMGVNMVLNILFVVPWVLSGTIGPHAGLALATGLTAYLNAYLLYRGLRREGVLQLQPGWGKLLLQVVVANVLMAALLLTFIGDMEQWSSWDGWTRTLNLFGWIAVAGAVYFAVLFLLGVRPRQLRGVGGQ